MPSAGSIALPFPHQGHIALVARGKTSRGTFPFGNGHADVILPSGAPAGFLVHPEDDDGRSFIEVRGWVYNYASFSAHRPQYVNMTDARANNEISGVLLIRVTPRESERFQRAWQHMRASPGNFTISGNNCATHAARAFAQAGLVNREIRGLDTPDNLFHALLSQNRSRCRDEYGYLGFMPRESAPDLLELQCDVGMEIVRAVPAAARTLPRGLGVDET